MNRVSYAEKIEAEGLPDDFEKTIDSWYRPIAGAMAERRRESSSVLFAGVQGCQGSGKSTLASFLDTILTREHDLCVAVLSIDDFYLTKVERNAIAKNIHPLLATRGVPGTHDVNLAMSTIDHLLTASPDRPCLIPRFDKSTDDRRPKDRWDTINHAVDIIILEGWCVGLEAQEESALTTSVNDLERQEDPSGIWRRFVNQKLRDAYAPLFERLNCLAVLKAPSFECVFDWRLLQEEKLIAKLHAAGENLDNKRTMSPGQIRHFISHYQRLTEHALTTLPSKADWLFELDEQHCIRSLNTKDKEKTEA